MSCIGTFHSGGVHAIFNGVILYTNFDHRMKTHLSTTCVMWKQRCIESFISCANKDEIQQNYLWRFCSHLYRLLPQCGCVCVFALTISATLIMSLFKSWVLFLTCIGKFPQINSVRRWFWWLAPKTWRIFQNLWCVQPTPKERLWFHFSLFVA